MIDSSTERSPGCLAPYQLRNIFLKYMIIISIIGIYKNGIIFYNLQVRLYNRLNWPMKSMYKFSLFTLLNLISVN